MYCLLVNNSARTLLTVSLGICLLACGPDADKQPGSKQQLQNSAGKSKSENSSQASGNSGKEQLALTIKTLRIDTSESSLASSADFAYFEAGHFGDKTQYMGRIADELGGAYAVHCRAGQPFSIEVKYQNPGIDRQDALRIMNRLLSKNAGEIIEHDDEDLKKKDAAQAAEFFYFKGGPKTELLYANNSTQQVVQINVWSKNS